MLLRLALSGFLACILSLSLHAQDEQEDSLQAQLRKSGNDSFRVGLLMALSKKRIGGRPEEAIRYALEARDLSQSIGYPRGTALALKGIGMVYYNQGKYLETLDYWNQSLKAYDSLGDQVGVANLLSNIGAVYSNQTEDDKALEYYFKALEYALQLKDKLRLATVYINIGNVYYHNPVNHSKALDYFIRSLPLSSELKDDNTYGSACANIGEIYLDRNHFDSALYYFRQSEKALRGSEDLPYALNNLGRFYTRRGEYDIAIRYHQMAFDSAALSEGLLYMTQSHLYRGDAYYRQQAYQAAITAYRSAVELALKMGDKSIELKNAYLGLSLSYAGLRDYKNAYEYDLMYSRVKDTLYNLDLDKKLASYQTNFDLYRKQQQVDLLQKDRKLQQTELKRQKIAKNALIVGLVLFSVIIFIIYRDYRIKIRTNKILDSQKAEIEHLLLNVLPAEVAEELQKTGSATPRYYEQASVLFTDFKGFSALADRMQPQEVVSELNSCFIAFDDIVERYGLEKIKTIGDSYMCAGGIPTADKDHIHNIIRAGLAMQACMISRNVERVKAGLPAWEIRVGINTGPLVAGVVGKKKYAYDIWGGSVNVASRMESNGEPGRVNISAATYELVKDRFQCSYRGKIYAKNIGEIDMYFVDHEIPA